MSADLTELRDHARDQAVWVDPRTTSPWVSIWCRRDLDEIKPKHDACAGVMMPPCSCRCHPIKPGPSDDERALWTQIADEIDAFLKPAATGPDLFGPQS